MGCRAKGAPFCWKLPQGRRPAVCQRPPATVHCSSRPRSVRQPSAVPPRSYRWPLAPPRVGFVPATLKSNPCRATLSRSVPYFSRLKSRISRIVAQKRESNTTYRCTAGSEWESAVTVSVPAIRSVISVGRRAPGRARAGRRREPRSAQASKQTRIKVR
eukprot:SAG31_NODE_676_length_12896_cov_10.122060_10_plen_159_part_00